MNRVQFSRFLLVTAGLAASGEAHATGASPCVGEGYRPAFAVAATSPTRLPTPYVDGHTAHLFGHDFDWYVSPIAIGQVPGDATTFEIGPAVVLSANEVVVEVPPGIRNLRVWLEDEQLIHTINNSCSSFEAPHFWEVSPDESCEPGTLMCHGATNSAARTPDLRTIEIPIPAPENLRITDVRSNAAYLGWSFDAREAPQIEVEHKIRGGRWQVLGRVSSNQRSEPIFNLSPGFEHGFRIRAVDGQGHQSDYSNEAWVELPEVFLNYWDSRQVPHPFYSEGRDQWLPGKVTSIRAIYDSDGDGIVAGWRDYANTSDPSYLYPSYLDPTSGTTYIGARYAPGANVIVHVEFESWGDVTEYAAVHLQLGTSQLIGVMTAGVPQFDLILASWQTGVGGEIQYGLPSYDVAQGALEGSLFGNVLLAKGGVVYGTQIAIEIPEGIVINDERDLLP